MSAPWMSLWYWTRERYPAYILSIKPLNLVRSIDNMVKRFKLATQWEVKRPSAYFRPTLSTKLNMSNSMVSASLSYSPKLCFLSKSMGSSFELNDEFCLIFLIMALAILLRIDDTWFIEMKASKKFSLNSWLILRFSGMCFISYLLNEFLTV